MMRVTGAQPGTFQGRTDFLELALLQKKLHVRHTKEGLHREKSFVFFSPRYS